jgi:AcrR family transcriptional regulator
VLAAILDEAAEQGPAALNVKQVAERAGVSVGSLYQYFGNRRGLLDFATSLCARFVADTFDSYRPLLAALPLREGLAAYLAGGLEWSETQAGLVQFFLRAAYHGDPELAETLVRPVGAAMLDMVRDMLAAAAARGELRADVDLEAAARVVNLLAIALGDSYLLPHLNCYYQVTDDAVSFQRSAEAMVDLILHGLAAHPEPHKEKYGQD